MVAAEVTLKIFLDSKMRFIKMCLSFFGAILILKSTHLLNGAAKVGIKRFATVPLHFLFNFNSVDWSDK